MVKFRESQRKIVEEYNGGLMGISAVPGSGKTFTLSHLAARLVEKVSTDGEDGQEVLIVTFSNSAANSFKKRIADILQRERQLLPYVGYRVRTLHGLAHDIVRERPSLVGLAEDFQIIDERAAASILRDVVFAHLPTWNFLVDEYISGEVPERRINYVRQHDFPELFISCAGRFIKYAKDYELSPADIQELRKKNKQDLKLLDFMLAVYADYQRTLAFRGAVDFDDLVLLALRALRMDPQYLERLRKRWVYILEDEAQDSSFNQENMLRLLTNEQNWVRVGDPNQAINTTFTTADPKYLRAFLDQPNVQKRELPVSGRSGKPIIDAANELVRWACFDHPVRELRDAFYFQQISPTPPDDPQPNPPADQTHFYIHYKPGMVITPDQELDLVVRSIEKWLPENQDKTVAALVPENSRGFKLVEALRDRGIPYEELLRSTTEARLAASYLYAVLVYLAAPHDAGALARLYRDVWWHLYLGRQGGYDVSTVYELLMRARQVEDVVYGTGDESLRLFDDLDPVLLNDVLAFLEFVAFCLDALLLPVDQLVLTISQRLFDDPVDLALSYRVSSLLRSLAVDNLSWSLAEFAAELRLIVDNQRRFLGFDDASEGYVPRTGVVTVATMHAAKGLEWDRVYLLAVSNYGFPSLQGYDSYVSERWFVRDSLNLEEEVLGQLGVLVSGGRYKELECSIVARGDFAAERLRLLYVALTRACVDLTVQWNNGRFAKDNVGNSLAVPALHLMDWTNVG